MAYTKTTWVDRIVQYPRRFTKSGETGTQVTLVADPGTVTNAGTPVNATNLNKMENGIEVAHQAIDAASSSATPSVIIKRDANGRAKIAAPSASDDIARKDTVDNAIATTFRGAGSVTTNANFNSYTAIGIYSVGVISSSPNRPPATSDYGILEVAREGAYLVQRYTEIIAGITYQRTHWDGTNWSSWKGVGGVKSIQRGTATFGGSGSVNVTISGVTMSKCMLLVSSRGVYTDSSNAIPVVAAIKFNSATEINLSTGTIGTGSGVAEWQVIEYY